MKSSKSSHLPSENEKGNGSRSHMIFEQSKTFKPCQKVEKFKKVTRLKKYKRIHAQRLMVPRSNFS